VSSSYCKWDWEKLSRFPGIMAHDLFGVFSTVQESEHGYFEGDGDFLQELMEGSVRSFSNLAEKAGAEPDLLTEFRADSSSIPGAVP